MRARSYISVCMVSARETRTDRVSRRGVRSEAVLTRSVERDYARNARNFEHDLLTHDEIGTDAASARRVKRRERERSSYDADA